MRFVIGKRRGLMGIAVVLNTICALAWVYVAILLQQVTDIALEGDLDALKFQLGFTIMYLVACCAMEYIRGLVCKVFKIKTIKALREELYQGVMRRNTQDFKGENTANYLSYLTNDIKIIEDNFIDPLLNVIFHAVRFIGSIVVLFVISPIIGIAMIVALIVLATVPGLFGKALETRQDSVSKQYTVFTTRFKDILSGYQVIKSFNMKAYANSEFEEQNEGIAKAQYRLEQLTVLNQSVSELLAYFTLFGGIFIGAYFVAVGSISVGTLLALIQLSSSIVNPIMMIFSYVPKIQGAKTVVERLRDVAEYQDESFKGTKGVGFEKAVQIKDLSFTYEGREETALEDINLRLEKNKKYVIVGKSGCGKSTLVSILAGDLYGYKGEIYYDGVEIQHANINKIREMVAIIHQNVFMFDGTVEENISLYNKSDESKIKKALESSGAYEFITALDEGICYQVGENGNNLSGGQRQRLAVARGLYNQKPILIVDEGTSAVDKATARDIEERLLGQEDLTLVTITHHLSEELLSKYDEVIYMENGRIVEQGSFSELMREKGNFYSSYVS